MSPQTTPDRIPAPGRRTLLPAVLLLLSIAALVTGIKTPAAAAQEHPDTVGLATQDVPSLEAIRIQGRAPVIDGDLSDAVWDAAPVATDFVQVEPREGEPASERTEARVLYDDDALYVGIRAYDRSPDSIDAPLARRGQTQNSDMVHVIVDSHLDRRTAFHFAVNPAGVKLDLYRYDDYREDSGWEAVWDVATQIDSLGWTAEFRIPLSQLRYSGAAEQTWGINFARDIARHPELSVWAPLRVTDQAIVSRSGILHGIRDLEAGARIEILPYSAGELARSPGDAADPFWSATDGAARVGADLRMGVTSDLTLDLTVNPDFGQVEADPAQVNLTAFETFFPEQRPFFQEGASIFNFGIGLGDGDGSNPRLFYSRRIGRSPQGRAPSNARWVDAPSRTRILAAGKLSGRTSEGWSVGVLNALTGSEEARAVVDGERISVEVEPMTSYSVGRLQRDLRGGETSIGGIATATLRDGSGADDLLLHRAAYTGGMDFRHRFREGTMEVRGFFLGSRVEGSEEAIFRTQHSPARYYQRPDADHVEVDPDATSLTGASGALELWKVGGSPWRFASFTHFRTPGFEVNDLGFMQEADYLMHGGWLGYMNTDPGDRFRRWGLNTNVFSNWSLGGEHRGMSANISGHATTLGNRNLNAGVNWNGGGLNTALLRGGPAFRTESSINGWASAGTDSRKDLQFSMNVNGNVRPTSDSWRVGVSPSLRWRPSGRSSVRVGPSYSRQVEDRQWVDRVPVDGEPEYIFGRMEQSTLGVQLRGEMAVTPNLSVQLFAQPFVSSGQFSDFRRVVDPRASRYEDRFEGLDAELRDGRYRSDLTGDGEEESFRSPHFSSMQFRSNAVLRWEYRPGSTLFLVWSQTRNQFDPNGDFRVGRRMDDLFSTDPENVFMIKMSYWMNP